MGATETAFLAWSFMSNPNRLSKRREEVAQWIGAEIVRLGPGAKLPTVRAIMKQFSTSQRVVQDALAPFISEGQVTSRRGAGIVVASKEEPKPDQYEADVLVLYRLSDSRLANNLLLEIERRMKTQGVSILVLGFADDDHAESVLQRLGRFRTCLVQIHFALIPLPLLALLHQHADSVIVDGISATGVGLDGIGTNWREALSSAWFHLQDLGHQRIAYLTSAHSARQIAMARREYQLLSRADHGGDSWLLEIDALPGSYKSEQIRNALADLRQPDGRFPFTALVVWGVVEGYRLELALRELGIEIGSTLSVVMLGSVDFGSEHLNLFDVVGCSNAEKLDWFERIILLRLSGEDVEPQTHYLPIHLEQFGSAEDLTRP